MFRSSRNRLGVLLAIVIFGMAGTARAQVDTSMLLTPWNKTDYVQTYDRLVFEPTGHVRGTDERDQIWMDQSIGRARFHKDNPDAFTIGWQTFTVGLHPKDPRGLGLPKKVDEVDVAVGIHLFSVGEFKFSTILGAGFSGNNLFAGKNGILGIGHLLVEHPLNKTDSLALTLDYDGARGLLPDIPLPGFALTRKTPGNVTYTIGFPRSQVRWEWKDRATVELTYEVPYTADLLLTYPLSQHVGLYGEASQFWRGFEIENRSRSDRFFFQNSRVEGGVHLVYGNFFGRFLDVAVGVGYAFNQRSSNGFDVRNVQPGRRFSDEPYVALYLRGKF